MARSIDTSRLAREIRELERRIAALRSAYDAGEEDPRSIVEASLAEATLACEQLQTCLDEVVSRADDLAGRLERGQNERALLRVLYRRLPMPVLVLDEHAIVRRANDAACAMLNVSSAYVTGKPFPVFLELSRRATFRSRFAMTVRSGSTADLGTRVVRGNGVANVRLRMARLDVPGEPRPRVAVLATDFARAERAPAPEPHRDLLLDAEMRLELLLDADRHLVGEDALDDAATIRRLADLLTERFADWAVIDMRDDAGTVRRRAVATGDPVDSRHGRALLESLDPMTDAIPGEVISGDRPAVLDPVIEDETALGGPPERPALSVLGAGCLLCVPIRRDDERPLGAITLVRSPRRARFELSDLGLTQRIAEHLALARQRQRLYARRSHTAAVLERSLMPAARPHLPGIGLHTLYRGGTTDLEVGGDFFDIFPWSDCYGVVLGDVCGKGADAAAVTAAVRHGVRLLAQEDREPDRILRRINRSLLEQGEEDRFVTAVLASVVPRADGITVRLTSAGHPRPLILRADGTVNVGLGGGIPLGLVDDLMTETQEFSIESGGTMLLYTDGVTEARDPAGNLYGEGNLSALLARASGQPPSFLTKAIDEDLTSFTRGTTSDDIAIVAMRAEPERAAQVHMAPPGE